MSQVVSYRSKLRIGGVGSGRGIEGDPGWEILCDAVRAVAEEFGGVVCYEILDFFGRPRRCSLALRLPQFPRGVGVEVCPKTGWVSFLYDDYGINEIEPKSIVDRITQNHIAFAVARALREMNYAVEIGESEIPGSGGHAVTVRGEL